MNECFNKNKNNSIRFVYFILNIKLQIDYDYKTENAEYYRVLLDYYNNIYNFSDKDYDNMENIFNNNIMNGDKLSEKELYRMYEEFLNKNKII